MSRNSYQRSSCMLLLTSCHPSERLQLDWRLDGLVSSTPFFFFICLKPLWDSDGAKVKGSTGRRASHSVSVMGRACRCKLKPCLDTLCFSTCFYIVYVFLRACTGICFVSIMLYSIQYLVMFSWFCRGWSCNFSSVPGCGTMEVKS